MIERNKAKVKRSRSGQGLDQVIIPIAIVASAKGTNGKLVKSQRIGVSCMSDGGTSVRNDIPRGPRHPVA